MVLKTIGTLFLHPIHITNTRRLKMITFDIYEAVTNRIITELEKGIIPWRKPWKMSSPKVNTQADLQNVAFNRITKTAYGALNQMLLSRTGEYASFKQWKDCGGSVKSGTKAEMVVFWKWLEKAETDSETGETKLVRIPFLKYYNVFHIDDIKGVEPLTIADLKETPSQSFESEQTAEAIIANYSKRESLPILYKGNQAYYSPMQDHIVIPERFKFSQSAEFYSTVFHEITHSTGAKHRLDRLTENGLAMFGNEAYSKEELVAEIGASGMLSILKIESQSSFINSTAYIQNWLQALRNDKRLIVTASSRAEKAIDYILNGRQQQGEII